VRIVLAAKAAVGVSTGKAQPIPNFHTEHQCSKALQTWYDDVQQTAVRVSCAWHQSCVQPQQCCGDGTVEELAQHRRIVDVLSRLHLYKLERCGRGRHVHACAYAMSVAFGVCSQSLM
jgi:hypothetical protein